MRRCPRSARSAAPPPATESAIAGGSAMSDVLAELSAQGVAIWLDDLSRERLVSGSLESLMRDKHVVGVTTNPTIFQKALEKGSSYDEQIHELALRGIGAEEAVRTITTYDVRWAC